MWQQMVQKLAFAFAVEDDYRHLASALSRSDPGMLSRIDPPAL
jgi:hypothetical protein